MTGTNVIYVVIKLGVRELQKEVGDPPIVREIWFAELSTITAIHLASFSLNRFKSKSRQVLAWESNYDTMLLDYRRTRPTLSL